MAKTVCQGVKADGIPCRASVPAGARLCLFHDPDRVKERRAVQAAGGRRNTTKTLPSSTPDLNLSDYRDVIALLSATINEVRKGKIDPRVANAIGYLAAALTKTLELARVEGDKSHAGSESHGDVVLALLKAEQEAADLAVEKLKAEKAAYDRLGRDNVEQLLKVANGERPE